MTSLTSTIDGSANESKGLRSLLRNLRRQQVWAGYVFLLPALLGLLIFAFIPFVLSVYYSFTDYNVLSAPVWKGLGNYIALFNSKIFWTALVNTAYYTVVTVPIKMALGLLLALLLNERIRGLALFRALIYSPVVTAMVAVSIIWLFIYNPSSGLLNTVLKAVGLPAQLWLLSPTQAMPSLMIMGVWKWVGSTMIIYLAALQGIPDSYYEAASIDGASRWQSFWRITLPLLRPAHIFNLVTMTISSFQVFEQIYVMTEGGPGFATTTLVYEIYSEAFQKFHMGYASAMAVVLFIIILALTLLNFRTQRDDLAG
jgi:ABC-type sugar transport system permease subunit